MLNVAWSCMRRLHWQSAVITTHDCRAQLYMRNVSSSNRLKAEAEEEEELPPPARLAGDIIRFDRCLAAANRDFMRITLAVDRLCPCKHIAADRGKTVACGFLDQASVSMLQGGAECAGWDSAGAGADV
jgi:hypothetical protein